MGTLKNLVCGIMECLSLLLCLITKICSIYVVVYTLYYILDIPILSIIYILHFERGIVPSLIISTYILTGELNNIIVTLAILDIPINMTRCIYNE